MIKLDEKQLVIPAAVAFAFLIYWLITSDSQPLLTAPDKIESFATTAAAPTSQELIPR